jgi:GntR family transcriptional regulator
MLATAALGRQKGSRVAASDGNQPRYERIARYLRELIAGAEPGRRLPSDAELCERFGVSRMTARHAVDQLARDGLLYRRRGQGTFVASRPVPRVLGSPLSFTESMRRRGVAASSRLLLSEIMTPTPDESETLRLGPDDRVVVIERLRLADGIPMALERAVLIPSLVSVLEADLENGSLHAAMDRSGRIPSRSHAQVMARPATLNERRLLDLARSGVVLCERHLISDEDGVPLEYTDTRYAAERYVFEVVLYRDDNDVLK